MKFWAVYRLDEAAPDMDRKETGMSKPQPMRLETGGRIDRDKPLLFTFDGKRYGGFAGDTLASAITG